MGRAYEVWVRWGVDFSYMERRVCVYMCVSIETGECVSVERLMFASRERLMFARRDKVNGKGI